MAQKYGKQKTTVRRSIETDSTEELPRLHRQCLLTLTNYCIVSRINVYLGRMRRDGTLPVKFYTEDGPVEDFLAVSDEPLKWAADIGADLLPREYHAPLADDLAAVAGVAGPSAPKAAGLVRRVLKPESDA